MFHTYFYPLSSFKLLIIICYQPIVGPEIEATRIAYDIKLLSVVLVVVVEASNLL